LSHEAIPVLHEQLAELAQELAERGHLGLLTIDVSTFDEIEHKYGTEAYSQVRQRVLETLSEQSGKDFRGDDLLALDQPLGNCLLLFLGRKRRRQLALSASDLRATCSRLRKTLLPTLHRATFPYMKVPPRTALGYGLAIHNPLVSPTRILGWALQGARECAIRLLRSEDLEQREQIQDLIVRERIGTAYQPIVSIADRTVLGFEALSRGAHGTGLESALELFGAATRHHLLVELDRLCRSKALLNSTRLPSNARLFVNTLPATIRDPLFRGQSLIDFLDRAQVAPTRLVIEITEKLVIENYGLFQETMAYFTDLGMSFAIDDVGAGYSGLEAIARLKPAFLKIDMGLVRDVHISLVNREMVKAIVALGRGIGAAVIAEGIQTEEELNAIAETGAEYGQGFYLARPEGG